MQYEIYVDRVWLINFILNYDILTIVNACTFETATKRRRLFSSGVGATFGMLSFLIAPGSITLNVLFAVASMAGMLIVCFKITEAAGFGQLAVKCAFCAFALGGGVLFLSRVLTLCHIPLAPTWLVIVPGGITTMAEILFLKEESKRGSDCTVLLRKNGKEVTAGGIIDSGNSLTDPYTGRPVSVVSPDIYAVLSEEGEAFRLIPFRSVGETHGLLEVYTIPEAEINIKGIQKRLTDVAVGVPSKYGNTWKTNCVEFIINPAVLQENGGRNSDDIANCNAGENTVSTV